jgi:hypothetical protein
MHSALTEVRPPQQRARNVVHRVHVHVLGVRGRDGAVDGRPGVDPVEP